MHNVNINFDHDMDVVFLNRGASVAVGENFVTNCSLDKTNQGFIHVGDGVLKNHIERVVNIDRDVADTLVISLNDFVRGLL
jgi:hypothetical protein